MTKRSTQKGTAPKPGAGIAAAISKYMGKRDDGPEVSLTDLLAGDLQPASFGFTPPALAPAQPRDARGRYAHGTLARGPHAGEPVEYRSGAPIPTTLKLVPHRPVGLHGVVVELLDACATDDGVAALSHTPGIPGSGAMNPLTRALARALGTDDVWIGEAHETVRVSRAGTTVVVPLPERLRGLLDSIELRPELYPDVRPGGAR